MVKVLEGALLDALSISCKAPLDVARDNDHADVIKYLEERDPITLTHVGPKIWLYFAELSGRSMACMTNGQKLKASINFV